MLKLNTIYSVKEVKQLFSLLYKLEDHLETAGNENYGVITQCIQDLNQIGIKA